jgi:hypothetical protein
MSMSAALVEDRRARASKASFALGRFVVPASRLAELGEEPRALSLVYDAPFEGDPRVEAVELPRPGTLSGLATLAREVYVELEPDENVEEEIARLGALGLRSKVRCGGTATPTVADLARFVHGCRRAGVAFKATAGLHGAVRHDREHGFLNLLAAVVFGDEESALAEEDADSFALDASGFRWREQEAGTEQVVVARERLHAIGSCSFFEPVEELERLGMLPPV